MERAVVALALGGCFTATPATGVPCDPAAASCPRGQACVLESGAYVCSTGPGDVPEPDAMVVDSDGDGVGDATDNCPTLANPAQSNYDRDRFGDACDPCPPIGNDMPADTDDDGVADACDPEPAVAGDRIIVFDTFAGGTAGWTATGNWITSIDGVTIDLGAGAVATLLRAVPAGLARTSVATAFTATQLRTLAGYAGMGVMIEDEEALACTLLRDLGGVERIAFIRTATENPSGANDAPFALGVPHVVSLATAEQHRCRGDMELVMRPRDTNEPVQQLGVRARGAAGTFHYVLVVGAP